ncbi:unnamed protein product [Macrosiphum euphorbiae]|uniref:MULE transposase domain-containing protein n=1 Tax=Macrosiphum euphorbiae TaxID=13131 RepID=A0AAV0W854_9HEMI|nr:unnamed protein product [Macrosiphum euphorbiae]
MNIDIVSSIHGGILLNINNFIYKKNKDLLRKTDGKHVFYWICVNKCGAKIRTVETNEKKHELDKNSTFFPDQHCHAPDPIGLEIYQKSINECSTIVASHVSKNSVQQLVKRQRRNVEIYKEPKSIDEICLAPTMCQTLKDGTFKACPQIFEQMYVIHGSIKRGTDEIFVPLVFALMNGKSEELYNQVFFLLNEFCLENNINITQTNDLEIITDFEKAAINSLTENFPQATHSTCFFHLCQIIYRKIQNIGLSTKYANDPEFNLLARHLPAMAFLPVDRVQEGWAIIKPLFGSNEEEQSLLKYFEHSYIIGRQVMKTRGRPRRESVYTPPLFPPELWSVAERLSTGLPRTTNTAESWHRKLNRLISPHPGLYKLIKTLQSTQNETEAVIEMLLYGRSNKKMKIQVQSHNIRLKEVQQRLLADPGYDLLEYLRGIAQNAVTTPTPSLGSSNTGFRDIASHT